MEIGIIGGGASGMAAAIAAAQSPGSRITVLERQAKVGRKLLATGNGRCNLTNRGVAPAHYHGEQPDFVRPALEKFPVEDTLAWFRSLGLCVTAEPGGKIYPYSDQANSVVDVLRFALQREEITLRTGCEVTAVRKLPAYFQVCAGAELLSFDQLVVCCGGPAGSKLGGTSAGIELLKSLGHRSTPLRPSLVQLKSSFSGCAALKGVRANCRIRLLRDGAMQRENEGEIQFTQFGISGPVVFEISRDACRGGHWTAELDFLPQMDESAVFSLLCERKSAPLTASDLLTGVVHNRLGRVIVSCAQLSGGAPISSLRSEDLRRVARLCKRLSLELTGPLGFDAAQVTAGGIQTAQFCPETMESRLVPGLFACGEVLDIDGDCGGYNLQWAWSSGRLAGQSAGRARP